MANMQEYLGWRGVWQASGPDQATGYNEVLADVIAEGATAGASKASPQGAPLQDIPLRLALVGAPFAGKTSMALKLADDHGCKVCCAHYCGSFRQCSNKIACLISSPCWLIYNLQGMSS